MKLALWLSLSQLLHGVVHGFTLPQTSSTFGTSSQFRHQKTQPLFAEEGEEPDEDFERPTVPVPPKKSPGMFQIPAPPAAKPTNSILQTASAESEPAEQVRIPVQQSQPKSQLSPDDEISVVASGIGAAFLGSVFGGLLIFEFPDLDVIMEPVVWPLAVAALFFVGGFAGGSQDNRIGEIIRGSLGKGTRGVGNGIILAIKSAIDSALQSAQNKIQETTEELKALPNKVADAAANKVDQTVDQITKIPAKFKGAAVETAEGLKVAAIKKTGEVVDEIKATPGRVVETSKRVVEDVVDDTLDAVEKAVDEVVSIPKKAVESVEGTFNEIIGTSNPTIPQPPKVPPPVKEAPLKRKAAPAGPAIPQPSPPKLEVPKVTLPKIEMPKIQVPKVEVPKFNLPKIDLPKPQAPKVQAPNPVKASQPKKKEVSEIFEIQAAVRRATEETRKEISQRQTGFRQESSEDKGSKAKQAADNSKALEEARKRAAAAKKEQAMKAADTKRQREEDAAAKKVAAEEAKRQREEVTDRRNAERKAAAEEEKRKREATATASKAKLDAVKQKQAKAAEKTLQSAIPRRTISLGDLFGAGRNEVEEAIPPQASASSKATAPAGVPTVGNWKQNNDGSITGRITGSPSFKEGETITTSPVPDGVTAGGVVKTSSGSRYFLGQQGGGFSFGFSAPKPAPTSAPGVNKPPEKGTVGGFSFGKSVPKAAPKPAAAPAVDKGAQARRAAEEKRVTAAEERRQLVEAKKAAQAATTEARRRAQEEMQTAQAVAVEAKRQAQEEKKAAMIAAAEARRSAQEEKKATAARAAEERKQTIAAKSVSVKKQATPKATKAPRGIPEIRTWKKRRDGGVSGRIYGSRSFSDGDFVETSPINSGSIENGSVVATSSGSRYFLSADPATKKANIAAAIQDMDGAKPGATITLTRERKQREAARAMESIKSAKPRATFSLFGLGFGAADEGLPEPSAPRPSRSIPQKQAPRGVPAMSRWKKNFDGSITGLISGSKSFSDGDRVTTSPIASGKITKGEIVTTGSGSKYFLS